MKITSAFWSVPLYSYRDYRSSEDYSLTPQFWLILAVRFAFVILFEVNHFALRKRKKSHSQMCFLQQFLQHPTQPQNSNMSSQICLVSNLPCRCCVLKCQNSKLGYNKMRKCCLWWNHIFTNRKPNIFLSTCSTLSSYLNSLQPGLYRALQCRSRMTDSLINFKD